MNENMTGRAASCAAEGETRSSERNLCINAALAFLTAAVLAVVGLILGAAFSTPILNALSSIIVLAVVLTVIIIAIFIFKWCVSENRCSCRRR